MLGGRGRAMEKYSPTPDTKMSHFGDSLQKTCTALRMLLSFAELCFDGLGRRKLPISM
jgi:hypothetical protein